MTEKEIADDITRLIEIFRAKTPSSKNEIEAAAIAVRLGASTISCLHRIADALEGRPAPIKPL